MYDYFFKKCNYIVKGRTSLGTFNQTTHTQMRGFHTFIFYSVLIVTQLSVAVCC